VLPLQYGCHFPISLRELTTPATIGKKLRKGWEIVDNKMVGDRGFEPGTFTVCKRHKKKKKQIK